MHNCELGSAGWVAVATALVGNPHIVSVLVGDTNKEGHLSGFMQTMQGYPPAGPLRHLCVLGKRAPLATEVWSLQQALQPTHTSISFLTGSVYPFYVLSGVLLSHIPDTDLRVLLTTAHTTIM